MTSPSHYADIINSFLGKKILVIGDLIVDVYLKGISTRLSPEAPVPVVDISERKVLPGGAANTVCNLRALGAKVTFCTVTGDDHDGDEALRLLTDIGVSSESIFRHPNRKTLVKTRVVSGTQLLIRFDAGTQVPIEDSTNEKLIRLLEREYGHYDAVVLSDYDKGIISPAIVSVIGRLQSRYPKFLAIDSKRLPYFSNLHPTLVKPNYEEAIRLLNAKSQHTGRVQQLDTEGKLLFEKTGARLVATTLDQEGSLFFENGEKVYQANAPSIPSPSVSGAGDTFLSAFTLAYINCGNVHVSAEIATAAATIAVRKESTSACSTAELKCYFQIQSKCVFSPGDLSQLCESYQAQGKRVVFTNGCFDILHSGHVTYLRFAKALGDVLIVGINNDKSIQRIKGNGRPVNSLEDRIQVLSGLSAVDHIIPFGSVNDDTPIPVIKIVRPDIFVKGGDYSKDKLPEAKTIEEAGGKIIFIPFIPDHSTTSIIQRINSISSAAAIQSPANYE